MNQKSQKLADGGIMAATVIGIYNMKGGVSKTTSTINIAAELALTKNKHTNEKNRVLIIDADSQCTATKFFLGYEDYDNPYGPKTCIYGPNKEIRDDVVTLYDVLKYNIDPYQAIRTCEFYSKRRMSDKKRGIFFQKIDIRVDVIPCHDEIYDFPVYRDEKNNNIVKNVNAFVKIIDLIRRSYDYIMVDFSPSYNYYTQMILNGLDYVIAPVSIDQSSSLEGYMELIKKCEREAKKAKDNNIEQQKTVNVLGAYYTETEFYKKNASEKYEKYRKSGMLKAMRFFDSYVRYDKSSVIECERLMIPACIFSSKSKIAQDYEALTKEIVARVEELNR